MSDASKIDYKTTLNLPDTRFPMRGDLAKREPQTLCRLTLFCSDGDIHASNAGYQVIGDLMWDVSGYK